MRMFRDLHKVAKEAVTDSKLAELLDRLDERARTSFDAGPLSDRNQRPADARQPLAAGVHRRRPRRAILGLPLLLSPVLLGNRRLPAPKPLVKLTPP